MRSDAVKLSQEDYEYIMKYKDAKSKPLDMLRDKYPMSNTRFYQIWKGKVVCTNTWNSSLVNPGNDIPISVVVGEKKNIKSKSKFEQPPIDKNQDVIKSSPHEITDLKKAIISSSLPNIPRDTEDIFELYKKSKKEQKNIISSGQNLASKLIVP